MPIPIWRKQFHRYQSRYWSEETRSTVVEHKAPAPLSKNRDISLTIFRFSLSYICLDDIPCIYALLLLKIPNDRLFKKIHTTLNHKVWFQTKVFKIRPKWHHFAQKLTPWCSRYVLMYVKLKCSGTSNMANAIYLLIIC